jgi:hypothetical protein
MKIFLRKSIVFIAIPLLTGIVFFIVYTNIVASQIGDYQLDSGISEIFIGDSHIQSAVNDSLIIAGKNFGQFSESVYYSYFKLKLILAANPNIKKVYLGFSYHSLSNYYDDFAKGKYAQSVSPKYFFILTFGEQFKHVLWNLNVFPSYIKRIIKSGIYNLSGENNYTFSGGYSNPFSNASAIQLSMAKRINYQFYKNKQLNDFSAINQLYLHEIINLCKNNNVELVLFNTPMHAYYRSNVPIEYINKYNHIIEKYQLKVIDFSDLTLEDDCYLPDGEHVSEKGALLTTKEFLRTQKECLTFNRNGVNGTERILCL